MVFLFTGNENNGRVRNGAMMKKMQFYPKKLLIFNLLERYILFLLGVWSTYKFWLDLLRYFIKMVEQQ